MEVARKKIVVAAEIYPPDIGGPATYAYELREQLLSHGYIVQTVTFGDKGEKNGIHCVSRRRTAFIRLLIYFFIIFKLSWKADVIYAMGPGVSGLCAVTASKFLKKRVVVKVTGDRAWEAAQLKGSEEGIEAFQAKRHTGHVGILERTERWVVRHADAVVVPGNFLKGIVEGWGTRGEKIYVVPNAVDISIVGAGFTSALVGALDSNAPTSVRAEASPAPTGVYEGHRGNTILAIGRLVPWKGFDDLIAALPRIREKIPNAELVIVGEGPERGRLEASARDSGVAEAVRFVGRVPHEALRDHWMAASVFALMSSYEGFSHLVLEAWASGVPVVASDIPANRDIIEHGKTGILVPYKNPDALAKVLVNIFNNAALASQLTEGGKKELEKYRWERVLKETEKVLFG